MCFFGEEEKGGIGASRYIESVGEENISAMVNADVCGFGDNIFLSDKGNLSNPLFFGLMDETLLTKHTIQLPGFLPQGDDCIFEGSGLPSVSICTAECNAFKVFSEIGRKIAAGQPITDKDQEALMNLDVVKTIHDGELDNISHLTSNAIKMVADYLIDGFIELRKNLNEFEICMSINSNLSSISRIRFSLGMAHQKIPIVI